MNTTIGAGRNSVRDFAIDFTDKDTHIGGRSFPKGYFTVAVLNYGKETITKLLYAGAKCNQAMADMTRYSFRTDSFDALADAVFTIQHTLSKLEPFCYLDVLAEEEVLRDLFSEEAKNQPYTPLRATQAWPTSPCTPGGKRLAGSFPGIRAHRGVPPPLQCLTGGKTKTKNTPPERLAGLSGGVAFQCISSIW